MSYDFTASDIKQITEHGLNVDQVQLQLERFRQGFPNTNITEPALTGNGIRNISDPELMKKYIQRYDAFEGTRIKFVPASGAATRMFKDLHNYLKDPNPDINPFEEHINYFPFYKDLRETMIRKGENTNLLVRMQNLPLIINLLLEDDGLGLANLPKALIPFHKYAEDNIRTALEEHLVEGALYAKDPDELVHLHFTISPHHLDRVKRFYGREKNRYESEYKVRYRAQWSIQEQATDTIAVNPDMTPFRDDKGRLLFRPAGHGALIKNLQTIDRDIIFIKNIDNVAPDRLKNEAVRYKKAIAGLLLDLQDKIFEYLHTLEGNDITDDQCNRIIDFCRHELFIRTPTGIKEAKMDTKVPYLQKLLNRPLRICGMVPNEGAPGGGPFWVRERNGSESLQIVETAQIDLTDPHTESIILLSKFFNPVDIVCSIKDYKGNTFNLSDFVDHNTGFIAEKSVNGQPILAMELPGLWNGAMAKWNTLFVQVPAITFTPVKTFHDLIAPLHQTQYMDDKMNK